MSDGEAMPPAMADMHKVLLELYHHVHQPVADDVNEKVRVYVQGLEAEIERLHALLSAKQIPASVHYEAAALKRGPQ
jgi:hypothetical protein